MFDDTLTLLRYPTVTDHGAAVINLAGTPTARVVTGCDVQPGAAPELLERRESTRVAWTVYAPAGTDVLFTDHAKVNGGATVYRVAGEPFRWGAGTSGVDHVVILLERWVDS
jgi:hypothetical protein